MLGEIGLRLQWLREAFGKKQAVWARDLGISVPMLNKWEAGTRMPNLDMLVRIVKASSASMDYLFLGRLTAEMNPELRDYLFRHHGADLELRVLPGAPYLDIVAASCPPSPRKKPRRAVRKDVLSSAFPSPPKRTPPRKRK